MILAFKIVGWVLASLTSVCSIYALFRKDKNDPLAVIYNAIFSVWIIMALFKIK